MTLLIDLKGFCGDKMAVYAHATASSPTGERVSQEESSLSPDRWESGKCRRNRSPRSEGQGLRPSLRFPTKATYISFVCVRNVPSQGRCTHSGLRGCTCVLDWTIRLSRHYVSFESRLAAFGDFHYSYFSNNEMKG